MQLVRAQETCKYYTECLYREIILITITIKIKKYVVHGAGLGNKVFVGRGGRAGGGGGAASWA